MKNSNNRNNNWGANFAATAASCLALALILALIRSIFNITLGALPTVLLFLVVSGIVNLMMGVGTRSASPKQRIYSRKPNAVSKTVTETATETVTETATETVIAPPIGKSAFLKKYCLSIDRIVAALVASLMLSYIIQLFRNGNFGELNDYFNSIPIAGFILIALAAFIVLIGVTYLLRQLYVIPWALMTFTLGVSILFAVNYSGEDAVYFALGVGLIDFVVILWEVRGDKLGLSGISVSRKAALIIAGVLFVTTTFVFGYFTSAKYYSYYNYTFDFGIFSQMFEGMARTGLPYTTVERSYLMTHFGVHCSPFFYLLLPGYYLFRSPVYLFYAQAAGVAAGVFGIWLLAGKLGLSGKMILALELLYAFYPCLFAGTFYDFHENKFLTSIILFLFYFIVAKKTWGIFGFSLLLLSVKEDAALYLMVIALFVMLCRKEVATGFFMLIMAIAYFLLASQIVAWSGNEGVMISRLKDYFINGEQSFGSVIKALFFDIGHMLQKVFTTEKMPFLIWMFAPVVFAPFMTEKISSLVLLLPILPINVMQSWKYQYDVSFQYTYGVAALIIVSAIFAIVRLSPQKRRMVLMTALCLSIVMSVVLVAPKIRNANYYMKYTESTREQVDELIDSVPSDATVTADHALVPHLYKVKWLYSVPDNYEENHDKLSVKPTEADYFVVDTRSSSRAQNLYDMMGNNYTLVRKSGFAELYERKLKVKVTE